MTVMVARFSREGVEVETDLRPHLEAHWQELALYKDEIPLDPDWHSYRIFVGIGSVRVYTVRLNGTLIGYALFTVLSRHLHYNHRWAINDILWIDPEHRNMGNGNGLCDTFEEDLRREGPIVIHIETKEMHPELAYLLRARGYGPVGPSFSKRFA
jgi:GNAT superfamily N-acetyltransferase